MLLLLGRCYSPSVRFLPSAHIGGAALPGRLVHLREKKASPLIAWRRWGPAVEEAALRGRPCLEDSMNQRELHEGLVLFAELLFFYALLWFAAWLGSKGLI